MSDVPLISDNSGRQGLVDSSARSKQSLHGHHSRTPAPTVAKILRLQPLAQNDATEFAYHGCVCWLLLQVFSSVVRMLIIMLMGWKELLFSIV